MNDRHPARCGAAQANGRHDWKTDGEGKQRREVCTACAAECTRDGRNLIITYSVFVVGAFR